MINKAFIEERGNRRMEPEMQDVYEELRQRNVPVELFTQKRILRRQLSLARDTLVVGYVQTMLTTFQQLGIQAPPTNDYPSVLQPFFHRRIWESTVATLISSIYDGNGAVFAKPKGRKKRFTGHVFRYPDDLRFIEGASTSTPLFCAEVVEWLSEYRVYVIQGSVVGIKHYEGDPAIMIDEQVATEAVRLLEQSTETTAAYALDFGVIGSGLTALIGWNDGYSLGSYELDRSVYTDLLITRWCEITGCETLNP
ncbi:MAG: ATP-grasp domain-containing protein [Chloroflexota bacterium]